MSVKVSNRREAVAVEKDATGISALLNLFSRMSPLKRVNRVSAAVPQLGNSVNNTGKSPVAGSSGNKKAGNEKPSNRESQSAQRRRSLQALLGSDHTFQSFCTVAQKVFNVPLACVCHVQTGPGAGTTVSRGTMASKGGIINRAKFDGMQRDVNSRFYAIFPEGNEVCVIEDCSKDDQVSGSSYVTGTPYVRFYAGAALLVNGVKVGALCIMDPEPRDGASFTDNDRTILLDLANAVSMIIQEKDDAHTNSNQMCAMMMVDMMQTLRTPLTSLNMATSLLLDYRAEKVRRRRRVAERAEKDFRRLKAREDKEEKLLTKLADSAVRGANALDDLGSGGEGGKGGLEGDGSVRTTAASSVKASTSASGTARNAVDASTALRKNQVKALAEIELLHRDREKRTEKRLRQEEKDRLREEEEDTFLDDLQKAVGELKVVVESSMCLGQLVVDKATSMRSVREKVDGSFGYCDMLKVRGVY